MLARMPSFLIESDVPTVQALPCLPARGFSSV
jgi:hypothetical protein